MVRLLDEIDKVSVAAAEDLIALVFDAFGVVSVDVLDRREGTERRGFGRHPPDGVLFVKLV